MEQKIVEIDLTKVERDPLLAQIQIEIDAANLVPSKSGWNNSTVLLSLVPILALLFFRVSDEMNSPIEVLRIWLEVFISISLFYDGITGLRDFYWQRFPGSDLRESFQWTDLINEPTNWAEACRFLIILASFHHFDFQVGLLISLIIYLVYGIKLVIEIAKKIFRNLSIIIPYLRTSRKYAYTNLILGAASLSAFSYFGEAVRNDLNVISAKDLYVGGLICIIFYLLRYLPSSKKTYYVQVLEEIHYKLSTSDISPGTAKQMLDMTKNGMTFSEVIQDFLIPKNLLLSHLENHLKGAVNCVNELTELIGESVKASSFDNKKIDNLTKLHNDYIDICHNLTKIYNGLFKRNSFKLNRWLLFFYLRIYNQILSRKTLEETEVILLKHLEGEKKYNNLVTQHNEAREGILKQADKKFQDKNPLKLSKLEDDLKFVPEAFAGRYKLLQIRER